MEVKETIKTMSDNDFKGLANILRIKPPKKKTPVPTPEEEEIEEAMDEYFAPTKDENLWWGCP